MDLLTAILACSLYRDDALVRAIAESNSQGNPYAVIDASLPPGEPTDPKNIPHSLAAAVSVMQTVQIEGGDPLLGFMQVPVDWAISFRRRPQDLFDACTNIEVATAKLSELDYDCSHPLVKISSTKPPQRRPKRLEPVALRQCVIGQYAEAIHMPEFATVVLLELEHQAASAGIPASLAGAALLPQAGSTPLGGNDRRIFLEPLGEATLLPSPAPTTAPATHTAVQPSRPPASPPASREPLRSTSATGAVPPLNR